jgi:predicted phosphodiesterase
VATKPRPLDQDVLYSAWARSGFNQRDTARVLGCSQGHISNELRRHGLVKPKSAIDNREITIDGKSRGLVLSDIHIPLTDYKALHDIIDEAIAINATDWCVIAGDFFHMDSLSRFEDKQEDADLQREIAAAKRTLTKLKTVFKRTVFTRGNHDEKFVHAINGKMTFAASMRLLLADDCLEVTGRDYVLIDSPEGLWRACHTRSYSRSQLTVPAKLAERHRCHVIGGHRHHAAIGHSGSGYWAVENGCFGDYELTLYLHTFTNDFPLWQLGGTFLIDGVPYCPNLSRTPSKR